jgi:hypothetical protein
MSMSNSLRYELNTGGSKRFKEARLRQQERIEVRINIKKQRQNRGVVSIHRCDKWFIFIYSRYKYQQGLQLAISEKKMTDWLFLIYFSQTVPYSTNFSFFKFRNRIHTWMYKVPRKLCTVSGNTAVFFRLFTGKTIYRWALL